MHNAMCNYSSRLLENWSADIQDWVNSLSYTYTNDNSGKLIQRLIQNWDNINGGWKNSSGNLYDYADASGLTYTSTLQRWSSSINDWTNNTKLTIKLDEFGNVTYLQFASYSGDTWITNGKTVSKFNELNFETYDEIDTWAGDHWENFNKTNYTYDKNYTKGNQLGFYWDTNALQWVKSVRQIDDFVPGTTFAKNFLIQDYFSFLPGWVNSMKQQSEVNADGLFTSGLTQIWGNTVPGWIKFGKGRQEYYPDGSIRVVYSDSWNEGTNTWAYHSRISYTHNGALFNR